MTAWLRPTRALVEDVRALTERGMSDGAIGKALAHFHGRRPNITAEQIKRVREQHNIESPRRHGVRFTEGFDPRRAGAKDPAA